MILHVTQYEMSLDISVSPKKQIKNNQNKKMQ